MPKKQRKLKLGLRHILPALIFVLVGGSVAFYGTTQVKPGHADTAAYYSCNSGDTLSGSTCTHKSTYAATASTSTYYYCSHQGTVSGTTCSYPATYNPASSTTYKSLCKSGDSSSNYNWNGTGGYHCAHYVSSTGFGSCPSGEYYSFGACYTIYRPYCNSGDSISSDYSTCTHTTAAYYSCSTSSDSRTGSTCYYSASSGTTTSYSCTNGDSLSGTTCTHVTTYAATYHPATGGATTTTTGTTKSTTSPVTITPSQPPSAPTGLKTNVVSSKVVELSWTAGQAAAGVQDYEVDRSLDNLTWVPLGPLSDTSFTDTGADFATKYYYRVREVDNNGVASDYVTANVTTGKFSSSGSKITSDDKLVTVNIPNGAFDQEVSCSVTSPDGALPSVPTKSLLIGPYSVLCISQDGTTIASFKKPLQVTMDLSGASGGYGSVTARLYDNSSASDAKSTYDAKTHKISFELAANKSFAVYGKKQGLGVTSYLLVLVLIAGVGGALYLRRYWAGRSSTASLPDVTLATMPVAAPAAASMAAPSAPNAQSFFEQAVNKPNCTHLNMAHQVQPQTSGCAECMAEHKKWHALRICLTCGHVGCSDDSEEQHALKHYQQTGHPLIYEYANPKGDSIGWCYIDQTYV